MRSSLFKHILIHHDAEVPGSLSCVCGFGKFSAWIRLDLQSSEFRLCLVNHQWQRLGREFKHGNLEDKRLVSKTIKHCCLIQGIVAINR